MNKAQFDQIIERLDRLIELAQPRVDQPLSQSIPLTIPCTITTTTDPGTYDVKKFGDGVTRCG